MTRLIAALSVDAATLFIAAGVCAALAVALTG